MFIRIQTNLLSPGQVNLQVADCKLSKPEISNFVSDDVLIVNSWWKRHTPSDNPLKIQMVHQSK